MNLKSVKAAEAKGVKLDGISMEWEWRDGSLYQLTLTDAKGQVLRVAMNSYSMQALIVAPVEKKTVFAVKGTIGGRTGTAPEGEDRMSNDKSVTKQQRIQAVIETFCEPRPRWHGVSAWEIAGKVLAVIAEPSDSTGAEEEDPRETSRFEDSATYRQGLIDAGRAHLVR